MIPAEVGRHTAADVRVGHPQPPARLESAVAGRKLMLQGGAVGNEYLHHVRRTGPVAGAGGSTLGQWLETVEVTLRRVEDQAPIAWPDLQLPRQLRRAHGHILRVRSGS